MLLLFLIVKILSNIACKLNLLNLLIRKKIQENEFDYVIKNEENAS